MNIFQHRIFYQWAKSEYLNDEMLKQAVDEIGKGLYEANLGGGLYKKRIAMPGKGKRGSYRTLIAFKDKQKAFFVYGFAKNVRDNTSENETKIYRQLAKDRKRSINSILA
jgi:hypothetical protein